MVLIGWASNPVVATICILLPIIAGFSVGLRILARCVVQKNAGWDDGCIGASLVCFFFSFLFFLPFLWFTLRFPFFWEGNWDEREGRGEKGWIDGGREEGENEREVGWKRGFFGLGWIGLDW